VHVKFHSFSRKFTNKLIDVILDVTFYLILRFFNQDETVSKLRLNSSFLFESITHTTNLLKYKFYFLRGMK
jgi:hypothetical protein